MKRATREECYKAMREGKKITHNYFTDEEFLRMDDKGVIRCENGYNFEKGWGMRVGSDWDDGWWIK